MIRALLCLLLIQPLLSLTGKHQQLIVGIPSSWKSSAANLSLYEKLNGKWVLKKGPWKVRLGRSGSAWGLGLHPLPAGIKPKREGDRRTPAGLFSIGGAWGYLPEIQHHPKLPYRRVTPRDLWVEDPQSPFYNQHRILPHHPQTTWEKKQQMKQGDHAHSLKLFIAHNPPPKANPGSGSAIFFHIWRGEGSQATAGCTTMSEERLKELIAWINPDKQPAYLLLPQAEYQHYRVSWKLP